GSSISGGILRVLENQWPSPPRRRAPVAPNEEQLRGESWYHSRMSRRDAEKLLVRDGDFLVRESTTNPGQYVLTGMHSGLPKHLLLVDPEGVVQRSNNFKFLPPINTKSLTVPVHLSRLMQPSYQLQDINAQ
uniref:SH2 domain-containing protein n=1 Tax=Gouania willdenowi TaxID=441366 RepID=A0A8C5EW38_GOUWI